MAATVLEDASRTVERMAASLAQARASGRRIDRLSADERPRNCAEALAVQMASSSPIGGWKCALPGEHGMVVAPIRAAAIVEAPGPFPATAGLLCEPEFAFILARGIDGAPDRESVLAAVGEIRLALEVIGGRYRVPEDCGFLEMLADDLFNDGVILGPPVALEMLDTVREVRVDNQQPLPRRPDLDPIAPLVWLAGFQAERGMPLTAGTVVITGSLVPAFPIGNGGETTVTFGDVGSITTRFAFDRGTS